MLQKSLLTSRMNEAFLAKRFAEIRSEQNMEWEIDVSDDVVENFHFNIMEIAHDTFLRQKGPHAFRIILTRIMSRKKFISKTYDTRRYEEENKSSFSFHYKIDFNKRSKNNWV